MAYPVKIINDLKELEQCHLVTLDHVLWGKGQPPKTTARMGYLPNQGIVVEMTAHESNPLCRYTEPWDPVYRDSAMECFLTLDSSPHQDSMYANFEFNASGAMLADFGEGKGNRGRISTEEYALAAINTEQFADYWTVRLVIPNQLLQRLYGVGELEEGDSFYFNLYKISEEERIEHYGSFFPVTSETPNFHRPQDFGQAVIVG